MINAPISLNAYYGSGSQPMASCLLLTGKSIASNQHYSCGSRYRKICLLITGKNRQKLLNLPYFQRLISVFIPLLRRINARVSVNFHAAREVFFLRKFRLKYQAKTGKINRQITGISGKNRQVSGKNWLL